MTTLYGGYTDEMMKEVRRLEQKKAAFVGEFAAVVLLDHPSAAIKNPADDKPRRDILAVLRAARAETVYTHNLADKHDTHVAVTLRTIEAIRSLDPDARPKRLYGCEVWREPRLDAGRGEGHLRPVGSREPADGPGVGVFDSQICGGKRYDLATEGRRRANATYAASHGTDKVTSAGYAMDLTPLVTDTSLDPLTFVTGVLDRFRQDVVARVSRFRAG